MEDLEAQKEEIAVLKSIFPEDLVQFVEGSGTKLSSGKLIAKIHGNSFSFLWKKLEGENRREVVATVDHLPPVCLHFVLPADYPSKNPPRFVLSCSWLGRKELSELCRCLDQIWSENSGFPILFMWMNFITDDAFYKLGLTSPIDLSWISVVQFRKKQKNKKRLSSNLSPVDNLDGHGLDMALSQMEDPTIQLRKPSRRWVRNNLDSRAVNTLTVDDDILMVLSNYDASEKLALFQSEYHTCKVCFSEKPGSACLQFTGCSHVYCKDCMKSYFEVKIRDGEVKSLTCPEEKCMSQASPMQIRDLLDKDTFNRYDSLLLSSSLATADTTYCPRTFCQYPVVFDQNSTLASCPSCLYNFCIYCKMTFHGVEPCKYGDNEKRKLLELYQKGTAEEKLELEKRYGRKQLQSLADNALAEEWIESNSKSCPHCRTKIEKSDGCNKMLCWKCNTPFCWLCGGKLNPQNPYLHFNVLGSGCFNRLFQGMDGNREVGEFVPMLGEDSSDDEM